MIYIEWDISHNLVLSFNLLKMLLRAVDVNTCTGVQLGLLIFGIPAAYMVPVVISCVGFLVSADKRGIVDRLPF